MTMPEIIAILEVLSPSLSTKTLKHWVLIVESMLSMTGRVTMLGLSRWTEKAVVTAPFSAFSERSINGQNYAGS
jgi:hypothetical protein